MIIGRRDRRLLYSHWPWLSVLLAILIVSSMAVPPVSARQRHGHHVNFGPVDVPRKPARSPHQPSALIRGTAVDSSMVGKHAVDPVDMKVLVITADGKESGYLA